jgi:hypothetical protein
VDWAMFGRIGERNVCITQPEVLCLGKSAAWSTIFSRACNLLGVAASSLQASALGRRPGAWVKSSLLGCQIFGKLEKKHWNLWWSVGSKANWSHRKVEPGVYKAFNWTKVVKKHVNFELKKHPNSVIKYILTTSAHEHVPGLSQTHWNWHLAKGLPNQPIQGHHER